MLRRIIPATVEMAANADPSTFDLLLSDIVMPGLAGPRLAATLRERRPDLPIVFMSGYAESDVIDEIRRISSQPLLTKPFSPTALLTAVRLALDEAAAARDA